MIDLDTIGYFLFMEEQERETQQQEQNEKEDTPNQSAQRKMVYRGSR